MSGFAPGSSGPSAGMEVHDVLVAVDGVPVSLVEKGFQFETLYNEVSTRML